MLMDKTPNVTGFVRSHPQGSLLCFLFILVLFFIVGHFYLYLVIHVSLPIVYVSGNGESKTCHYN